MFQGEAAEVYVTLMATYIELTSLIWMHSKEKTGVLAEFISKTNSQEMQWIIMILLKGDAGRL